MLPILNSANQYPNALNRFLNDNWLDNFWGNDGISSPSINIAENDNEFTIELAAPGLDKKDFHVNVEDNRLVVSYEHKEENEEKGDDKNYIRREFKSSAFTKSFTLPDNVNADKISAKYHDGILDVSVPKVKEKSKLSRMIKIS